MVVVRFADDFVVGFERRGDAERFLAELRDRFARFGLALHPDKTRLLEFGRFPGPNRRARGDGKPETFNRQRVGAWALPPLTPKEPVFGAPWRPQTEEPAP
jgi:hypothetical protein